MMSGNRQAGHALLITIIVILAVAILAVLGWLFWQNFVNKPTDSANITNFEECKASPGSRILETYPEQCITAGGQTFTGPSATGIDDPLSYCSEAEKLCFEYPKSWVVDKKVMETGEPGSKADLLEVKAPDDELVLMLMTGIGGIGGFCPDENKVTVRVLAPTPAISMTGYAGQYTIDTLQVARVVYPVEDEFVAALYLTPTAEYSTPGTLEACGIGFSAFIEGKHSILSPDFPGAGSMTFGYTGQAAVATYANADDAIAVYDTPLYQQAAAILASVHYQ